FSAERDRLLRGRGRGPYGTSRPGGNGYPDGNGGGGPAGEPAVWNPPPAAVEETAAVPIAQPAVAAVPVVSVGPPDSPASEPPVRVSPVKPSAVTPMAVATAAATAADAQPSKPEAADEPPAPRDAVPIQAAPAGAAASVEVVFESGAPIERLLPAIESVTQYLRGRPGPLA